MVMEVACWLTWRAYWGGVLASASGSGSLSSSSSSEHIIGIRTLSIGSTKWCFCTDYTHTHTLFRCISFLHVESNKKKLLIPKKGCWLLLMILFDKKFFLKIKLTNNIFKVKSFNYSINLTKLPIDVVHEIIFAFWHTPQCENTVENHLFKPRRYLSKSCFYLFCI